jgi:hypothetical protein
MRYIKILSLFVALGLFTGACKTEMIDQIDVFSLENGAYMRHVSPWPFGTAVNFSKAGLSAAQTVFSLEAVDSQKGTLFTSYDLTARFVDRTPANGSKSVDYRAFVSIPASSFSPGGITGYPTGTMTIRAADLMRALGLTDADVSVNDLFEVQAVMKLSNGRSFSATTSDPDILGGLYYRSPFFYRFTVVN